MTTGTLTAQEQIARYAAVAWRADDLIEVRCIHGTRDGARAPVSFWTRAGELPNHFERMEALNAEGMNVFCGILPRAAEGGKSDADTLPGVVVWSDFDGVDPRGAWKIATEAGLPKPSMAVNSGHGAHLYWALTEPIAPAELSALVGDIAALCGSDASVRNPSRILRLPGFKNWKEPVADALLLYADAAVRYSFAELRAAVPERQEAAPGAAEGTPARDKACSEHGDLLRRATLYLAEVPGVSDGGRNAAAFRNAANLRRDFSLNDGDSWRLLVDWNRKNMPPLPEGELRAVFASGGRYAKHSPGTLANASRAEPCRKEAAPPISVEAREDDLSALRGELEAQRSGERRTLPLPWPRLSAFSHALRPGTVCVLAGPPGTGKSFFAAHIALAAHAAEVPWRYLPLEDRRIDFQWRLLAMLAQDYVLVEDDHETAGRRAEALDRFAATLEDISGHVTENPRVGHRDAAGKTIVPALPYQSVLDWIARAFNESARVVFVDPVSQIEFSGRAQWEEEANFMRHAIALANDSGGTVVFVAHTAKRGGKASTLPLTLEDVQGSAMFGRLCHCALLLDAHDPKESSVYRHGGLTELVEHNRTLLIAKTRNASGARQRIAFNQRSDAPVFDELGVIAPRERPATPEGENAGAEFWNR